jgi:hypothetical protein
MVRSTRHIEDPRAKTGWPRGGGGGGNDDTTRGKHTKTMAVESARDPTCIRAAAAAAAKKAPPGPPRRRPTGPISPRSSIPRGGGAQCPGTEGRWGGEDEGWTRSQSSAAGGGLDFFRSGPHAEIYKLRADDGSAGGATARRKKQLKKKMKGNFAAGVSLSSLFYPACEGFGSRHMLVAEHCRRGPAYQWREGPAVC